MDPGRGDARPGSASVARPKRPPGAPREPPDGSPNSKRGSHSSHHGRYQFRSPSSFIVAGSSTPRTRVASIRIRAELVLGLVGRPSLGHDVPGDPVELAVDLRARLARRSACPRPTPPPASPTPPGHTT